MKKENIRGGVVLLVLLVASAFFTWYFGDFFGIWYTRVFNLGTHSFGILMGAPIAYLLFIFFTVPLFIPRANKFIYFTLLFPAIFLGFRLGLGIFTFLFPFLFAIVGYLLALFVNRMIHFITNKKSVQ